jgi:hypothetical protein
MNLLQPFLLLNKAFHASFPVTGMDNILGWANITNGKYPPAGVITDGFWKHIF